MVGTSKNNVASNTIIKHIQNNYRSPIPKSQSKSSFIKNQTSDSQLDNKNNLALSQPIMQNYNQDWSKKLQALVNSYESYRHNFNDLLEVSPNLLRAVEGLYPDYGQFENVPNSGWTYYTPISMHQQNALSVPDKIVFGTKINNAVPVTILNNEKGASELARLHEQDGGSDKNNFERYTKKFNKALLSQLKNYVDLDGMATKTDDISRLAYTRLKSYFDTMDIILDDEKLQEFTGIALNVDNEKEQLIKKRLLPDPMDASQKGKPLSLWADDEKKLAEELKKSNSFEYLKPLLLDTATSVIGEANSLYNKSQASFMNPYEGMSDTVKNMLNVRRNHIQDYIETLPYHQANQIRELMFDNKMIGNYTPPNNIYDTISVTKGVLPNSYQSLYSDFFKEQREKFDNPLDSFRKKAKQHLDKMNTSEQFYIKKDFEQL